MPMLEEVRGAWRRQLAGPKRVHCGVQRDRRPMREGLRDMNIRPLQDRVIVKLSVANIHPRAGSTAPPCPSNLVIPLHGRLVSVMQASERRPRHSSAAWNLGYCRAAAGGGFLC